MKIIFQWFIETEKAKSMIFLDWMIEENICGPQIGKIHDQLEKKKKINCASNKLKISDFHECH